ncbi:MAG: DUF1566 domain-containing protein [Xenophilus sp.]
MNLHIEHATIHLSLPAGLTPALSEPMTTELVPPGIATAGDKPPAHGEYWPGQGGHYICTLPALLGLPARHVIAATAEAKDLAWGPIEDIAGATSHIDGPANTRALLARGDHPAAAFAAEQSADGHSDFHLPARLDLLMAFICARQLFKEDGWYWSSTQDSRHNAFAQDFQYGISDWDGKGREWRVRPFRWIPLEFLIA